MGNNQKVCFLGCLLLVMTLTNAGNVAEELEMFMRGALDSIKQGSESKTKGNDIKKGYDTNNAKDNSTEDVLVDKIGNFTENDNASSNVAKGQPAFGEGIGSGYHGHLPRGQYRQGQGFQGQTIIDTRVQRQYPGFGSPEINGRRFGGQGIRHNSNLQQGNIGQNRAVPRVPDGRMGLPRPDGCLCTGSILPPCCFELPKGVIRQQDEQSPRGQSPPGQYQIPSQIPQGQYQIPQGQFQIPQGHHGHPERQSGIQLPNGQEKNSHVLPPQTPIGLEYQGDFTCPVVNGNFPHPTDCSRFLQCAHYVAYDTPCPKGLLYDTTTGMCNWPDLVRCNSPTETQFANQIFNSTVIIPSTWKVSWTKCRSLEVAVNAVFISVAQAVLGKPCPNNECQFPYIIVNCLK